MNRRLLIIGFVWPEPHSSAAGSRMLQLVKQFQFQGYDITFASTANPSDKTFNLSQIGVETESIYLNDSSFDDFIRHLKPDVVLFDRFMTEEQFGWRVAQHCPDALRILDTEDFHGLRKGRAQALKEHESFSTTYLLNDTTKRELASIYRCDLSLIISEYEMDLLTSTCQIPRSLLEYLPFLIDTTPEEATVTLPSFQERKHFITIGNFLHLPNYDAIVYLKTLWPKIRQRLPDAELHMYGAYSSQKVQQLQDENQGFLLKGFAEHVSNVMQSARVCLAPLRFGAGLKGKLIDAMQNGTPCVMSSIAAEGMFGSMEPCGPIEDTATKFIQSAIALYTDAKRWDTFQNNGFNCLVSRFNRKEFESGFKDKIFHLTETVDAHRKHNIVGQLLQHQTMNSTKYMSRWIELKNKSNKS